MYIKTTTKKLQQFKKVGVIKNCICLWDQITGYKVNCPVILEMLQAEVHDKGILDLGEVTEIFFRAIRSGKSKIRPINIIEKGQ
jgi:hypothetical protein